MKRKIIIIFTTFILVIVGFLSFDPKEAKATFGTPTGRGQAADEVSDTTIIANPSANLAAGVIVFVTGVTDNVATADGATTLHSISDTDSNTWIKVYEETETDGAAGDGTTTSVWWTKVVTQIDTTDSITLTTSSAVGAKMINVVSVTVGAGNTLASTTGYTGVSHFTSGNPSQALSSLTNREYLFFGLTGAESADTLSTCTGYTELYDDRTANNAPSSQANHICYLVSTTTGSTFTTSSFTFTNALASLTGFYEITAPTAALTGTITSSTLESDIVTGGKTIILTLTNAKWIASGSFNAQRQNIINGLDSGGVEAGGWDAVVKATQGVSGVVRTSDTVVTITLDNFASYSITADETITATIPYSALENAMGIVASPTFTVSNTIAISGFIYSAEPSTAFNCSTNNLTISVSINGAAPSTTTCTASSGAWSKEVIIASTNIVNVWVSGQVSGTVYAETVYVTDGTAKTDINLWQNTLAVRYDTGSSITNANLSTGLYSTKGQQVYAMSGSNLTVDSNIELHVWTGMTYNANGGTVTTQGSGDLHVDDNGIAILDTATNTIAADAKVDGGATLRINGSTNINGGDITTSGTSAVVTTTSGTPTVTMSSSGSIGGGTTPTLTFHNLSTTGTGVTTIANTTTVNNDVSVAAGTTLTINASVTISGGDLTTTSTGIVNTTSGTPTVTTTGAGAIGGGSGTITIYNLTTNGSSNTTTISTNNIVISNALSVGESHVFAMGTNSLTIGSTAISDSGDITIATGASTTHTSGIVTILGNSGNAADWSGPGTFTTSHLVIGNGSTMTVDNDGATDLPLNVNGDFNISTNAIFQASSTASFTVGYSWYNYGTFTANSGTVTFDGDYDDSAIESGGSSFYNLVINGSGINLQITLTNAVTTVSNDFTLTNAAVFTQQSGSNLYVGRNFTNSAGSAFQANGQTVYLNGAADTIQTIDGNTTFYNLTATTGDRTLVFDDGDTFTIAASGTFTATGDSCTALIAVRSGLKGTAANITKTGDTTFSYTDIQDIALSGADTAANSIDSGGNSNLTIAANACISASTDSTSIATGYSFQRKTFFDDQNSRYWTFNHDGDEIEVRYSTNGTTWNNPATAASGHIAYDTNDFSVWWSSISTVEYVWMAVKSGNNIIVRRGTLSSTDIDWDTDAITALDGTTNTYSFTYFSLDSSNYMWVIARNLVGSNYVMKAVRSDVNDTGNATWDTSIGFGTTITEKQLSDDQTNANVFGNIVPLASQDMLATFVNNTAIESCMWDSSDSAWENSAGTATCSVTSGEGESSYFDSLSTNLVGYWKMNEASWNGTTDEVVDSSGNGNHGVRSGNATTAGSGFNRSGTFDGTGDYVAVTSPSFPTGDFTISTWFKHNGTNDTLFQIGTSSPTGGDGIRLRRDSTATIEIKMNNSIILNSSTTLSIATGYHFVLTRSGSAVTVYLNGRSDGTATYGTALNFGTCGDITIAADITNGVSCTDAPVNEFDGQLDDMRVYSRALSSEEVAKLYQLVPERVNIDDASDFGAFPAASRQVVRTKSGTLYSFLNDGGSCELWKSTDGVTWAEQDSATNPTCISGTPVALAIDSSDIPHIAYVVLNGSNHEVWWNTVGGDTFDTAGEMGTSDTYTSITQLDMAIDSNDIPHVVFADSSSNTIAYYNNRIAAAWNINSLAIETVTGATSVNSLSIVVDEDNAPEIAYINSAADTLTAWSGDDNDPDTLGQWNEHDVDTDVNDISDQRGASISVDTLTGNTWISYINDTSEDNSGSNDAITLAKRADGSEPTSWTTGWTTITTKTDVGSEPSIAIAGSSDIYVFYENDTDDISYDVYDSDAASPAWDAETVLQTGTFQDFKAKWAFEWNNYGANRIDYLFSDGTDVYWDYLYVRRSPINIDNASDFNIESNAGRQVVRTSTGVLYAVIDDAGSTEVWRSADNGNSWSQQDSADSPVSHSSNNVMALAIDSTDTLHILYTIDSNGASGPPDNELRYITFTTSTGQFGTAEDLNTPTDTQHTGVSIAIDNSNIPHIVLSEFIDGVDGGIQYNNRIGGSWIGTAVEIEDIDSNALLNADITISDENIPEVVYVMPSVNDLTAAIGDDNDPDTSIQWTTWDVDTTVVNSGNITSSTIGNDSSGNTWITYIDETGTDDYITLTKHADGTTWADDANWTVVSENSSLTNSKVGIEPSLAINSSDIYIFYRDDQDDIVFDKYNGSTWSGETLLEEHGVLQDVKTRWSFLNNPSYITYGFDYVYSDGTDVFYNRHVLGTEPGTQDSVATTTNGTSYSISAVSDAASPNDAHLLYLDNSSPIQVKYKRWDNPNGWQTAYTVDSTASTTNQYVSLTLDTSSKDLWAAWADQTGDDDIYYSQCNVTTTTDECGPTVSWGARASESTATGAVYNSLTTNYSSVGNVFGIWTNTTASPFSVSWSSINAVSGNAAPSAPTTLYTNESDTGAASGIADPVGVGDSTPVFSAVYADSDTGDIANKYEVIVYSDVGCTTSVWDSGAAGTSMTNCTQGNRCADINFGGTDLPFDGAKYYWKIKYWDDTPEAGSFSSCAANFTILSPAEQLKHGNYFFNLSTERKYSW